ncbi:PREDICTED: zinc finger protein 235-like [Ceratosolen solmsi marchali]|uniref:Zinc finger protein 235-like n=1 Tax=Ceratosolen solmsi marchali TaxID=326594 RepID=A0AAJ6YTI2_9HYME|nr:PREDICTED: zinc finger protein 235-like [Ceratosolen solmsi marchali]
MSFLYQLYPYKMICFVCNSNVDQNSYTNMFFISLPHIQNLMVNFVLKVLKLSLSDLSSNYICVRCYNLFGILEQVQWTAANIQSEILKIFENRSNQKSKLIKLTPSVSEMEKVDEKHYTNEIVWNHLSDKDLISLSNVTNKIIQNYVISNEVDIQFNKTSYGMSNDVEIQNSNKPSVISNEEESKITNCVAIQQCLENDKVSDVSCNMESLNSKDPTTNILSDTIVTADVDKKSNSEWQNTKDISDLQNDANDNKNLNSAENSENPRINSSHRIQSSWKSGRISKYSQKLLKHSCPTCNKKWRTSTELKIHMKSHSNLRPYMCEKCGQAYKHKHALEIHVGMHNGVSPFRCSHCNKCFTQKGALHRHLPMHTGEMPYQCELCGKRFVHHTSYNMHALSHTGKKSYSCHVCDLSLLSTSHLKRHMRVHSGEKPYTCSVCGKSFAERYNLLAHQKIHDPLQTTVKEIKRNHYK